MKNVLIFALSLIILISPLATLAGGGVVPCEGPRECNFQMLIQLINNLINYLILISIPIAALGFAYAGWLYITAGGNSGQVTQAHGIFYKILIGFTLVLAAWLIVMAITGPLLDPSYTTLG